MKKLIIAVLASLALAATASAQTFSLDARRVAMGGAGERKSAAADFAGDARQYRSIVIPLGLFQILQHREIFNPGDDLFDPLKAMEYAASPIHYTFNRNDDAAGSALVNALVNARLSRDLNAYRGFSPQPTFNSRGLASPSFGKTIKGVYFGVGPYISMGTTATIDDKLIGILKSSTNVYIPNSTFRIQDSTDGQGAVAITGGYRRRIPLPGLTTNQSDRDGLYISGAYNYLYGVHYDTVDLDVRFDTDAAGLVTILPNTAPIVVNRVSSKEGRGFAIDLGTAIVRGGWDVRGSVNGIGNRITWEGFSAERATLNSLINGADFVRTSTPAPTGKRKVTLPVQYVGGLGYSSESWSAVGELSHGMEGTDVRGGVEYRFGFLEVRGGGRRSRDLWHPAGGIGVNLLPGFGIDAAVFTTAANIEKHRKATIALSLRLGSGSGAN